MALAAMKSKKVQWLTKAFSKLSLGEIAAKAGLENEDEAERFVALLTRQKKISAKIDIHSRIVTFSDFSDASVNMQEIQSVLEMVMSLTDQMRKVDSVLSSDRRYLEECSNAVGGTRRSSCSSWKQSEWAAEMSYDSKANPDRMTEE